jgi:ArsR family transcriptional regulator, arsenate/arsenite/antimonite-responsive transcriptional repressor / arsenate reductase (thioredoxin)
MPSTTWSASETVHWSIPDPGREPGTDDETLPAFERTATEIETRVSFLLDAIENDEEVRRACLTSS